jgi:hypothetical protein
MAQTITWVYPITGTTPPTIAQALLCNEQQIQVNWSDSEITALLTHNWGLSAGQAANDWPNPIINYFAGTTTTLPQAISVTFTNTNVITLTKSTVVGGQGTLIVTLLRPFSEIT